VPGGFVFHERSTNGASLNLDIGDGLSRGEGGGQAVVGLR
jgi:hypothetical protein